MGLTDRLGTLASRGAASLQSNVRQNLNAKSLLGLGAGGRKGSGGAIGAAQKAAQNKFEGVNKAVKVVKTAKRAWFIIGVIIPLLPIIFFALIAIGIIARLTNAGASELRATALEQGCATTVDGVSVPDINCYREIACDQYRDQVRDQNSDDSGVAEIECDYTIVDARSLSAP
jgi:hypothetical protein